MQWNLYIIHETRNVSLTEMVDMYGFKYYRNSIDSSNLSGLEDVLDMSTLKTYDIYLYISLVQYNMTGVVLLMYCLVITFSNKRNYYYTSILFKVSNSSVCITVSNYVFVLLVFKTYDLIIVIQCQSDTCSWQNVKQSRFHLTKKDHLKLYLPDVTRHIYITRELFWCNLPG